jgi:transposase
MTIMGYSNKQKAYILQKVLPPENRPVHEVSKESGIAIQTIYKWMKQTKSGTLSQEMPDDTIPRFKNDIEKFSLILESKAIPNDQMGEWLRKNGLHSEHLILWEQELAATMSDTKNNAADLKAKNKQLEKEAKALKKELEAKTKALAEMAALYTLKKKAEALWGDKEDD